MTKKEIVKILIKRDNISEEDAWELVKEVEEVISSAEYLCQAEEAIFDILGLEPDYIMAFI